MLPLTLAALPLTIAEYNNASYTIQNLQKFASLCGLQSDAQAITLAAKKYEDVGSEAAKLHPQIEEQYRNAQVPWIPYTSDGTASIWVPYSVVQALQSAQVSWTGETVVRHQQTNLSIYRLKGINTEKLLQAIASISLPNALPSTPFIEDTSTSRSDNLPSTAFTAEAEVAIHNNNNAVPTSFLTAQALKEGLRMVEFLRLFAELADSKLQPLNDVGIASEGPASHIDGIQDRDLRISYRTALSSSAYREVPRSQNPHEYTIAISASLYALLDGQGIYTADKQSGNQVFIKNINKEKLFDAIGTHYAGKEEEALAWKAFRHLDHTHPELDVHFVDGVTTHSVTPWTSQGVGYTSSADRVALGTTPDKIWDASKDVAIKLHPRRYPAVMVGADTVANFDPSRHQEAAQTRDMLIKRYGATPLQHINATRAQLSAVTRNTTKGNQNEVVFDFTYEAPVMFFSDMEKFKGIFETQAQERGNNNNNVSATPSTPKTEQHSLKRKGSWEDLARVQEEKRRSPEREL